MKNKLLLIIALLLSSAKDTYALCTKDFLNIIYSLAAGSIAGISIIIYQDYYEKTSIKAFSSILDEALIVTKHNDESEIATLDGHCYNTKKALANVQQENVLFELFRKDEKSLIIDKLNEVTQCVKKTSEPWEKAKAVNNCFDKLCEQWKKTNPKKDCINNLCAKTSS